jgi:hypothetical protein
LVLAPHFAEIGAIDGWTSDETVGLDDARDAGKLHGGRRWELLEAWCQPPNLVVELSNWGLLGNHE